MADTRYLKKRRQTWYFVMKVPADLQTKVGKQDIVTSLGTRDLTLAQSGRWALVNEWTAKFEVLRGNRSWTPRDIEEKALREFKQTLQWLHESDTSDESLDMYIELQADDAQKPGLSDLDYALATARFWAGLGRQSALNNSPISVPPTFGRRAYDPVTLRPATEVEPDGPKFAEVAQKYINEVQRDPAAKLTEQTRSQYEAVYRLFDQWAEGSRLEEISASRASTFLDVIATLDPHWGRSPETKKRSFADIVEKFGKHPVGLGNRTVNRYATALSQVWQWASSRGLTAGENPWSQKYRRVGEKRRTRKLPFTSPELRLLLQRAPDARPPEQTYQNTLAWLCLIAAYTGMRLNEICERRVADIKIDEGVWYFDITNAKSEAGDRKVPIHSRLLAAGLLDFKDHHGQDWLFPALKPGGPDRKRSWYISKRFVEYRRELGVIRMDEGTGKDRIDFHSFRRTVIHTLERARLPQTEVAQVVGHEREGITFGTYNALGLDLKARREVVEAIRYPDLEQQ
jgi:integrase